MSKIKNIAVFTSIRSEYGVLKPLLSKLKAHPLFNLNLLVGGAHLSVEFGNTKNQIIEDGFNITCEFDFLQSSTKVDYLTQSMGLLQKDLGKWLIENKPALLLVIGDRFELLPVVTSALVYNIPIAHISGGDVTEGAVDNQVRHAITKMSHLHFPATDSSKNNILQMGEEEWRICVSGEPSLDQLKNFDYLPREVLFKELGLDVNLPIIISTFHPETINDSINGWFVEQLFLQIVKETNYQILVTASNFDYGGTQINNTLNDLSTKSNKIKYVINLGQKKYYSLLKFSAIMLGNSSSGIIEAQSFGLPVLNIGNRQKGRLANKNVIDVDVNIDSIMKAIPIAVSNNFKDTYAKYPNIYGDGNACNKIIDFIMANIEKQLLNKKSVFK